MLLMNICSVLHHEFVSCMIEAEVKSDMKYVAKCNTLKRKSEEKEN